MTTPEGKIKSAVKALLAAYDIRAAKDAGAFDTASGWYFMPTTAGLGVKGIPDFLGHFHGVFFGIETKAPGKKPSGFQALQLNAIDCSGGAVFVVDGVESLDVFKAWLDEIDEDEDEDAYYLKRSN